MAKYQNVSTNLRNFCPHILVLIWIFEFGGSSNSAQSQPLDRFDELYTKSFKLVSLRVHLVTRFWPDMLLNTIIICKYFNVYLSKTYFGVVEIGLGFRAGIVLKLGSDLLRTLYKKVHVRKYLSSLVSFISLVVSKVKFTTDVIRVLNTADTQNLHHQCSSCYQAYEAT